MSETKRIYYEARGAEAEEIIEHRAYNTTQHKQITALAVYETNAWFVLRIKKRAVTDAV